MSFNKEENYYHNLSRSRLSLCFDEVRDKEVEFLIYSRYFIRLRLVKGIFFLAWHSH